MNKLPFGKRNYQIMIAGLVVVAFGFTIMAIDKEQFQIELKDFSRVFLAG